MVMPVSYTHLDVYKRQLVNGVVDGIQIQGLCLLGQIHLACTCAALGLGTHHQVLLGAVGDNFAQQLCNCLLYTSRCV